VVNAWSLRIMGSRRVGVESEEGVLPESHVLIRNYPNPFNPSTTISYSVPTSGPARLEIFDLLGRTIRSLENGMAEAGWHHVIWDGRTDSGERASSGIYFARLVVEGKISSVRMTLVK
jgi:hypothetical protein